MAAINPARLKIQCTEIAENFAVPQQFVTNLHKMLNFYADRLRRAGEIGAPPSLLRTYNVSPPVLHYLEREMTPRILEYPQAALVLSDALWEEEWLETRLVAATILGKVALPSPDPILKRVQMWGKACKEPLLQKELFTKGLSSIREQYQEDFLDVIANFVAGSEKELRSGGLYALVPLLEDEKFQNVPRVYRMLDDLLRKKETGLLREITAVVKVLAKRSEQETVFFLQEKFVISAQPRLNRVVRRSLPFFSERYQKMLKEKLREG